MYASYFGLTKDPFSVAADPGFLFLSEGHREALAGLQYGLLSRKGFIVLSGDAGTGKSTLIARLRAYLPSERLVVSVISNSTVTASEFFELLLMDFGVHNVPPSKAQRLHLLLEFLLKIHAAGRIAALIVDEAHKLSREVLEEIRLLGNFDHNEHKLLQIVLVGQDELTEVLDRHDLRQLKQRVAVRLVIDPLTAADTEQYIQYRWTRAGGQVRPPFVDDTLSLIYQHSHGIPRLVNTICDNALLLAFGAGSRSVVSEHVLEACNDLKLVNAVCSPANPMPAARPPNPMVQVPAPAPAAESKSTVVIDDGMMMRSLERWDDAAPKRSWLARFSGKLRFAE